MIYNKEVLTEAAIRYPIGTIFESLNGGRHKSKDLPWKCSNGLRVNSTIGHIPVIYKEKTGQWAKIYSKPIQDTYEIY